MMISYDRYISIAILSHPPFVVSQTFLRYANTDPEVVSQKKVWLRSMMPEFGKSIIHAR